jgi:hypothetical protein
MAERYVSKFGLVELILIGGFTVAADVLNLFTLFLLSPLINGTMFIVLRLIFSLMGIKNSAATLIGLASPTVCLVAVYALERAKERSPLLAKADNAVSAGPAAIGK